MANYLTTDTDLTSVANAIRTKGGTSSQLVYPSGFVTAIQNIPTGGGGQTITWQSVYVNTTSYEGEHSFISDLYRYEINGAMFVPVLATDSGGGFLPITCCATFDPDWYEIYFYDFMAGDIGAGTIVPSTNTLSVDLPGDEITIYFPTV